ncbi:hypothetical protein PAAG_07552 [Paracoccidioides lutzii Pb01]|uniref:RNA polymerase II transcription factor SIII subunit A n=1 Tax=Paracoccidioides lutzii (strain ATCC MYA-826 / Pb01) TaxID=502779 RepID=C1H9W1_PARBA|nr:hypothetical protein PAAG_07552 [Paracoccidioides lutzii Pb01]EEH37134.1 hypothetical protein PAAG_07552 [Paracoccidioides lutzii Pb01]
MPAPSLLHLARKSCMRMIKRIDDIGLARYDLIRPVLQKIENPEQLHELELKSPHLLDHDAELWIEFIKRDVPRFDELVLPENPESWYDVYHELLEKTAREVDEDAERMKLALLGLDSHKAKHSSMMVDTRQMRLPREKPTAIQRQAFLDRKMGGIRPVFVSGGKPSGGRGLNPLDQSARWRLEASRIPRPTAKKSALPFVKRNQRLCIPTHRLNSSATQIVNAPRSLIEDYKRPIEQNIPKPKTGDPRSPAHKNIKPSPRDPKSEDLKTLTSSPTTTSPRTSALLKQNPSPTEKEEAPVTLRSRLEIRPHGNTPKDTTYTTPTKLPPNSPKIKGDNEKLSPSRLVIRKRPVLDSVLMKPKKRRL